MSGKPATSHDELSDRSTSEHPEAVTKRYDRAYFDRWYRGPDAVLGGQASLGRSVALAIAVTESVLDRPIRRVLDVGCGEGRWQPVLSRLRPKATYLGIDPSEYAVRRFGARRNLRRGSFEELRYHVFERPFDLVVCSDVLHYLDSSVILEGLDALVELVDGVALLEVFTADDEIEGDHEEFHARAPRWYRTAFTEAGLVPIGLQSYVTDELADVLDALDLPEV